MNCGQGNRYGNEANIKEMTKMKKQIFIICLTVVQYSWLIHPHLPFRGFLLEFLKPGHIALAHVNIKRESDAEVMIDKVRHNYKDIFVLLPGMPVKVFQK